LNTNDTTPCAATVRRIAVIGDTGCRLAGRAVQNCRDPAAWPFPAIAKAAAARRPDLVIHAGDYVYRELPCPPGADGCSGSPHGDTWDSWNADFFTPANPALAAAPWVFVRGNHEDCSRAWEGWFRFLDAGPFSADCPSYTDPVIVSTGTVQLIVMDDSAANDTQVDLGSATDRYAPQFDMVRKAAVPNAWLLMHRPLWAIGIISASPPDTVSNLTMQSASQNNLPSAVSLVLSGHGHLFEALNFTPERAPQMVIGNGGASLYPLPSLIPGAGIGGGALANGTAFSSYGFTTFEQAAGGWIATPRDVNGLLTQASAVALAQTMRASGQTAHAQATVTTIIDYAS
jgi:predicted phosphodiesterase